MKWTEPNPKEDKLIYAFTHFYPAVNLRDFRKIFDAQPQPQPQPQLCYFCYRKDLNPFLKTLYNSKF